MKKQIMDLKAKDMSVLGRNEWLSNSIKELRLNKQ